ncbi:MAG: S41 family peptidase [Vicinamibacterales bacterium]
MSTRTRLSVLLISTPLLAFIVVGGVLGNSTPSDTDFQHLRVFDDVVSLILNNYVEEPDMNKVMDGAMRGLADGLDPDSAYLSADEVKTLEAGEARPAGDVGVEMTRQYYLRIIAVRDNSPAAKAGLETGDYVRAIDTKPTRDMSVYEGMRLLRGVPGTKLTLTVIRGNAAEPRDFALVRERDPGAVVSAKMMPGDIGYIRIASFGPDAAAKIKSEAAQLSKAGAKHLLVDIRRNAEGPIDSGIEAARLFVKSGTLTMIGTRDEAHTVADAGAPVKRGTTPTTVVEKPVAGAPTGVQDASPEQARDKVEQTITAKPGDGTVTLPVTLLVTTGTSGAAEVFAAALVGNKRADMVGERTLGRAALQKLVPLPSGEGLWLTYARYLTPSGDPIQGKGLQPDQEVDEPEVEFDQTPPTTDAILDAALARVHNG